MNKKILVVGGGGVGGYIAHRLSQCFDVELLSNSLDELYIKTDEKKEKSDVKIVKSLKGVYDIIIIAVKSYQLDKTIKKINPYINTKTKIYPLLNGIEPYLKLKKTIKADVLPGAIYIISNRENNTIKLKGKGAMVVTDNEEIKDIFSKCGIKVQYSKNIQKAIWQKYLFIAATAALSAYYKATFGEIVAKYLDEFENILKEIVEIANKEGISLDKEDIKKAIHLLQKSPPSSKTSLQLDLEKGNKSELESILGYLAKKSPSSTLATIYKELLNSTKLK